LLKTADRFLWSQLSHGISFQAEAACGHAELHLKDQIIAVGPGVYLALAAVGVSVNDGRSYIGATGIMATASW